MKTRVSVLSAALILVLLASWASRRGPTEDPLQRVLRHAPQGIMGTVRNLVLVTDRPVVDSMERMRAMQAELPAPKVTPEQALAMRNTSREANAKMSNDDPDEPLDLTAELRRTYDEAVLKREAQSLNEAHDWQHFGRIKENLQSTKDQLNDLIEYLRVLGPVEDS